MTPDERERMMKLCDQISVEKNHHRFMELVQELNDLLARKESRLGSEPPHPNE